MSDSNKISFFSCIVILVSIFSGCSLISLPSEPPIRMQLHSELPAPVEGTKTSRATQLVVSTPLVANELDTDGIALIFSKREVRYLEDYRWTSTTPKLLQKNLINALEASNGFSAVADEASGLSSLIRLQTEIKQFALYYADENATPVATFQAVFRIVSVGSGRSISTLPVITEVPATGKNPEALTAACEKAVSEMLKQVVPWTIKTVTTMVNR